VREWLVLALLLPAVVSCRAQQRTGDAGVENVTAEAFQEKLQQIHGVLIDVRTPEEFTAGHIPSARLMNFHDPGFGTQVRTLQPADTVFVYCRSGNRSSQAIPVLQEAGITHIIHLEKGFNSWQAAGLPVEK